MIENEGNNGTEEVGLVSLIPVFTGGLWHTTLSIAIKLLRSSGGNQSLNG